MAYQKNYHLARDEALSYVQINLDIADAEDLLRSHPVKLLDRISSAFQERVTLQTILLHLEPLEKRRRPSWKTVKENVLSGFGGLCYQLNVFMYVLLKSLAYDVFLVKSSVSKPDNHVMTITRNVCNDGDLFLIDVGSGFPTFRAVDLTFREESPVYHDSFLYYKFVKSDGKIFRMHKTRGSLLQMNPERQNSDPVPEWKRYYDFELRQETVYDINQLFDHVFECPMSTTSHSVLRCTVFPGQKTCALRNNIIFTENSNRELEPTEYDSVSGLTDTICERFPAFQKIRDSVEESVKCWGKLSSSVTLKN